MKPTNFLVFVAIVAIVFAAVSLIITINQIADIKSLTGLSTTDIGTANLTITGTAQVNFTTSVVSFGSGFVPASAPSCEIDTDGNSNCTSLTTTSEGLILENIGNVDVALNLSADKNATVFLGGTNPGFEYFVVENKTFSCLGATNITSYVSVNTSTIVACSNFSYINTNDTLEIELRLIIPMDAAGTKGTIITATATAI